MFPIKLKTLQFKRNKIYRLWLEGDNDYDECYYVLIKEVMIAGDKILIGYNDIYAENNTINFVSFDKVSLQYIPEDTKEIKEELKELYK